MVSPSVTSRINHSITNLHSFLQIEIEKVVSCNEQLDKIVYLTTRGGMSPSRQAELLNEYLNSLGEFREILTISEKPILLNRRSDKAKLIRALKLTLDSLRDIYSSIRIQDSDELLTPVLLQKSLGYYEFALVSILDCYKDIEGSISDLPKIKTAASKANIIADIPSILVKSFEEQGYLHANPDVEKEIQAGNIRSGLEHFVFFGIHEVNQGKRCIGSYSVHNTGQIVTTTPVKEGQFECSAEDIEVIRSSKIIDEAWYKNKYGDCDDPVKDYCLSGVKDGKHPNFYFDQKWYLENNQDNAGFGMLPLLHYVVHGEKEGRKPGAFFDPKWYSRTYQLSGYMGSLLSHFLNKGRLLRFNPNRVVDVKFYCQENDDVSRSGKDVAEHCCDIGWKEERNPSTVFNTKYYIENNLNGDNTINPIEHYLTVGQKIQLATNENQTQGPSGVDPGTIRVGSISENIKYFANPGPGYEDSDYSLTSHLKPIARTIAFYLPQFHAFPENDTWWGKGFTEWRNVVRGSPRFDGHYQPRIPRDLGFYDLNSEDTLVEQAKLALENGLEGFCFYYYWFNGKRIMNKPLDMFAESKSINMPFSIMWANENWTRTWDGMENEVLIQQDYSEDDENDFIKDTLVYFSNEQYIRVDGRPLFIIYRPGIVPDAKEAFARWKSKWKAKLGVEPWIIMVQGFGDTDPSVFGLDGAIEFPPHKICTDTQAINQDLEILDDDYSGHAVSYDEVIEKSLSEKESDFPLIKTVVPHWDNDARREGRGFVMHGSSPEKYGKWLDGAIEHATEKPFFGESLVFINAWNEWAEGAYLEPDVHFGHAYLNATKQAIFGLESNKNKNKILLLGHDAHRHGAQMLLLNMARIFNKQFGMDVLILLKESGDLVEEYKQYADVHVLSHSDKNEICQIIEQRQFKKAISNTSVTGDVVPMLKGLGIKVVSLIHELPRLISEYQLEDNVTQIANNSDYIVFPSNVVEEGFLEISGKAQGEAIVHPQGIYKNVVFDDGAKARICDRLDISYDAKLIINVGYADLRKGFDLFLNVAKEMYRINDNVHFIWVGGVSPDMQRWIQSDLKDSLVNNVHCVGYTDNVEEYFSACDCFFLTSREDPYPSVVLEAMSVGKPTVLFKDTTGLEKIMCDHGHIVDRNNMPDILSALSTCISTFTAKEKSARIEYINDHCQFDDYCFYLLQLLQPEIKKISVLVPNYNYENYIESRLESIFKQDYPIFETIVLDDCSSDNSENVIIDYLNLTGRIVSFEKNSTNSGNTFKQWYRGLSKVRGEFVWIAEADDLADSEFLSCSMASFSKETVISFCDSKQVDSYGLETADSYAYYYNTIDKDLFSGNFSLRGKDFIQKAMSIKNPILNVSSVLWRTSALAGSLKELNDEIVSYKLVGDWRLYIDVLSKKGAMVTYLSNSHNTHRRHDSSVTHSLDYEDHVNEVREIHRQLLSIYEISEQEKKTMNDYIHELEFQFGIQNAA